VAARQKPKWLTPLPERMAGRQKGAARVFVALARPEKELLFARVAASGVT